MTLRYAIIAAFIAGALSGCGQDDAPQQSHAAAPETPQERVALKRVRMADPDAGRALFVDKGCVICHSVNGVGGKAAPPLDARVGAAADPLDFAARMWRGAPAMIELQDVELGYAIELSASEIADLAAFAGDRRAQRDLDASTLPESLKAGLLDDRLWEMDDWEDVLARRRGGYRDLSGGVEFEERPAQPE